MTTITPHHPSSPSRVGFAEQGARGCHTGLVESAAMTSDHAATRLRMATVQHPCLHPLGQQELPLDIPLGRKTTCASSATACPPSFRARVSGTELAIFHPSTHPHGAAPVPFYRPHELLPPTMSASLVHPKLDSLPALDMESDRLARACGQGPSFSARSSFSQDNDDRSGSGGDWDERPRTSERRGQPSSTSSTTSTSCSASSSQLRSSPPRLECPDFVGLGLGPGPASPRMGIRPRPHSVRVPPRVAPVPPIPHRPRSFSQPASIPVFAPSSPRAVLHSLQAALERDDAQLPLGECVDVQGVLDRWTALRPPHSAAVLEGSPRQEGAPDIMSTYAYPRSAGRVQTQRERGRGLSASASTGTFGAPVSVAVKCASMSTVLGGFQHPIPWVVYACVEELNRTGACIRALI